MGYNITKDLTIDGFTNLLAVLVAAGYDGPARLIYDGSVLQNMDGTVDCYFHATGNSASASGLTGTDGIPFGPAGGTSPVYTLAKGTDLSTVWLYSASAITVNAAIQG